MPDDIAERTARRVERALSRNWWLELMIASGLGVLFFTGIGLLIAAYVQQNLQFAAMGGILEAAIMFPFNSLIKLRKENIRLQVIPELIRFADSVGTDKSKELAFMFVVRLIEKV
jgi:hypothetical protein